MWLAMFWPMELLWWSSDSAGSLSLSMARARTIQVVDSQYDQEESLPKTKVDCWRLEAAKLSACICMKVCSPEVVVLLWWWCSW